MNSGNWIVTERWTTEHNNNKANCAVLFKVPKDTLQQDEKTKSHNENIINVSAGYELKTEKKHKCVQKDKTMGDQVEELNFKKQVGFEKTKVLWEVSKGGE